MAVMNLTETFPGLTNTLPVDDPFVRQGMWLLILLTVLVIILIGLSWWMLFCDLWW